MTFDEWHLSQTHEAYDHRDCPHIDWERFAWNAAIDAVVEVVYKHNGSNQDDALVPKIKELKKTP